MYAKNYENLKNRRKTKILKQKTPISTLKKQKYKIESNK